MISKCPARPRYLCYRKLYEIMALDRWLVVTRYRDYEAPYWRSQIYPLVRLRLDDIKCKKYNYVGGSKWSSWVENLMTKAHIKFKIL